MMLFTLEQFINQAEGEVKSAQERYHQLLEMQAEAERFYHLVPDFDWILEQYPNEISSNLYVYSSGNVVFSLYIPWIVDLSQAIKLALEDADFVKQEYLCTKGDTYVNEVYAHRNYNYVQFKLTIQATKKSSECKLVEIIEEQPVEYRKKLKIVCGDDNE